MNEYEEKCNQFNLSSMLLLLETVFRKVKTEKMKLNQITAHKQINLTLEFLLFFSCFY